jgi:hypothetical protein
MWFAANLLFKSVHVGQPEENPLWEERIVLIQAETEAEAREQGERLGKEEEHEYVSATGDLVRWTFQQIERVYPIEADTLQNRTEVFSRFLRSNEVESLLTPFKE